MAAQKFERVMRTRKLTPEEVARDREIRRKVEKEFPPARPPGDAGNHRCNESDERPQ
jgi:hypothetical protein